MEAFKATLEELQYADILLHVVDASDPSAEEHMKVVYDTLKELGCEGKPVITVFNKMDSADIMHVPEDKNSLSQINISAKNAGDLNSLLAETERILKTFRRQTKVLIPYSKGGLLSGIYGKCEILSEEHTEDGTLIEAYMDDETVSRLNDYIKE